jgi:hypothetical protein
MKKTIGILVMLIGLTTNAQTMNAKVDTLYNGALTVEFNNKLYVVDTKSNTLDIFNVSDDKMSASISSKYRLNPVAIKKRKPCPKVL